MSVVKNELTEKACGLGFESYFGLMISVNTKCYHLWLADLQKWLREEHKINVICSLDSYSKNKYSVTIYVGYEDKGGLRVFNTYEEALEEGLKRALELISITSQNKQM